MWKSHTGLIVWHIINSENMNTCTHTYIMAYIPCWGIDLTFLLMSHKTNPVLHPFSPVICFSFPWNPTQQMNTICPNQSSPGKSREDKDKETQRHATPTAFSSVNLRPSPAEAELKSVTLKLELCLNSAKCFISRQTASRPAESWQSTQDGTTEGWGLAWIRSWWELT